MSVSLRSLSHSFQDGDTRHIVFDNLNVDIEAGEVAAITGSSGSGKSTLISLVGLMLSQESGEIELCGQPTSGLAQRERARLRRDTIGFVFQSGNLFPSLTAHEQLLITRHMRGRIDSAARQRADELLESVGLAHRREHRPAQLSGGERQRVAIARALMNTPKVLLVDEPTAALDPERSREVMNMLTQLSIDNEIATLLVTHDVDLLDERSRHFRLEGGALTSLD